MSPIGRLWNMIRRSRLDDELWQEIETHLALIEEEERRGGSSGDEARARARSRFGNPLAYRERALDGVVATWLEAIVREIGFAARRLLRAPAFSLTSVCTLALAIAANVAIFAVVEGIVLKPLPFPDSDRLIELSHGAERLNLPSGVAISRGLYYHYAERARTLTAIALYSVDDLTLTGGGEPERIRVARVTPSIASVLQVAPASGRWFDEQDGKPGAAPAAVLSHRLWLRRYAGDRGIIGRPVAIDGLQTQIVGVMPPGFSFPDPRVEAWTALTLARSMGFGVFNYQGVARLREGVTVADARTELSGLIHTVAEAFPGDMYAAGNGDGIKLFSTATTLKEAVTGSIARALWILLAAVGVVLLAACANVANLFLVRSETRQREVAVRRALGAGTAGIARYFLGESVLLATAGGAIGVGLAFGAVRLLVAFGPGTLPRLDEVRVDAAVLAFAFGLSTCAAVLFGLVPLWRAALVLGPLHGGGRTSTAGRRHHQARRVLMAAQVALALVLLASSGLMLRSFHKLRAVDPGFNPASALTFGIALPRNDYGTRAAAVAAHRTILERLAAVPGVKAVAASTCLPLTGVCYGNTVRVEGRPLPPGTIPPVAYFRAVTGGYFAVMGIRLLRGRAIDRGDVDRREPVVVISQAFADRFFPNQDPLGQRVASNRVLGGLEPGYAWLTIVGVVANTPSRSLAQPAPDALLYMPMSIAGAADTSILVGPDVAAMSYVVRAATLPSGLVADVRRTVDAVDPRLAIAQVRTLEAIVDASSAQMAFTMVLIVIAAAVALLLGVVGIYGVMSYIVTDRTAEIGIRLALGADPRAVRRMIVRQGGAAASAGAAAGLAAALAGARLIESLLYGVNPRDPVIFAVITAMLLAVALAACWLPARRASRLSPLEALRTG